MAVKYVRSGAGGAGTGADWANAYLTMTAAFAGMSAGDTAYVSEDHAESTASPVTLTSPGTSANPCSVLCVNHSGTVPPVSADLATTATITASGANALTLAGYAYYYGITFNAASGSSNGSLLINASASGWTRLDSCKVVLNTTSASPFIIIGGGVTSSIASRVEWNNTTATFGATGQGITVRGADFTWKNTATALVGTVPTVLFKSSVTNAGRTLIEGVDLSALNTTLVGDTTGTSLFIIKDCKLNASVTVSAAQTALGVDVILDNSDSGATNYRVERHRYTGDLTTETTVVHTSGATSGVTAFSRKIVSTANAKWQLPFDGIPLQVYNSSTAANVTVTVEGIMSAAALPKNDEIWFSAEYLGSSSTPLGTFQSGTKADILATGADLTASTAAWDSVATARQNSHAYSLGDIYKAASNSGRLFIVTTAGTSAGSEPAGIASAVDGGSVTDGTAVVRAMMRFKKALTFSTPQPGQQGLVTVYPRVGKASTTYYYDPEVTLS